MEEKWDRRTGEIRELSVDELDKVSGGVGQEPEPDEPMGLCPAQASFEKWRRGE